LKQRLDATELWISKQADGTWTVQVLATAAEANLREYLDTLKKSIEINNIYVYRAAGHADQKALFSVFYGSYESQAAAARKLAELPAQLKANGPWPRAVQSIRGKVN
jgi:septal ring-binding cell division protein DamX